MAEYSKKLHIRKGNTVTDITLYTDIKDVEKDYLALRDGSKVVYASLVPVEDNLATGLKIRKGNKIYATGRISPLYAGIGIVMASAGNGTILWQRIRANGDLLRDPDPTGTVAEAVGIVMKKGGDGSTVWDRIDKDGKIL